ncbi:MAG: transporter [Rhodospirillales bacterium]|nr:transporter [Rhodospirillales bacterium]
MVMHRTARAGDSTRPSRIGMGRARAAFFAPLLIIGMSGCSVGPTYERPGLDVPATWRDQAADQPVWPAADWWQGFGSPQLDTFIGEAKTGNLDIAAAAARIREADAQVRVAGAALLPSVGFTGGATRSRSAPNASSAAGSGGSTRTLFNADLSASYEVDFWGANHASVDAARQNAAASRYNAETIALTTIASVATTYFQILELRDQIDTTSRNLNSAREILAALEAQDAAGTVTALDVAQQQTTVLTLEAQLPPLHQQLRQFTDALAILVGKTPQAVDVATGSLSDLSSPAVAPGLPSELLARRPDVAMAEAQLKAANADIKVARAAFLPSLQLTAQGGFESTALSSLFSPAGMMFSLAAGLAQPIFSGGKLEGQYQFSQAFYDELLADYRKSTISAFQDVEDALAATQQTIEQEKRQQAAVNSARRAYDAANAQLHAGTVNTLTVLNTESALFTAETTLAQVRFARLNAIVSLFKALGGGWQSGDQRA